MEELFKKVNNLSIAFDIIDGLDDRERVFNMEKRLQVSFGKVRQIQEMLQEYSECLKDQAEIEKAFRHQLAKLHYISNYFPLEETGDIVPQDNKRPKTAGKKETPMRVTKKTETPLQVIKRNETPLKVMKKNETPLKVFNRSTPLKLNMSETPRKVLSQITNINTPSLSSPYLRVPNTSFGANSIVEQSEKSKIVQDGIGVFYVTDEEFAQISSYMKGRLLLPAINEFVDIFNSTLRKKYDLMKKVKKSKSKPELDQCLIWKEQETGELIGTYFCTSDDFDKLSGVKLGNKKYQNIITILRHTKRLREIRNKKMTFYVASS